MFCHLDHFFFFFGLGVSVTLRGRALGVPWGGVTLVAGQHLWLGCDAIRGGGTEREQWRLLHSLPDFSYSLRYPQSNWNPLVLIPKWVGLSMP